VRVAARFDAEPLNDADEVVVAFCDFENETVSDIVGLIEGVIDNDGVVLFVAPLDVVFVGVWLGVIEKDCDDYKDCVDVGDEVDDGVGCGELERELLEDAESDIGGVCDEVFEGLEPFDNEGVKVAVMEGVIDAVEQDDDDAVSELV